MADEQIGIDLLLNSGAAATSVRELKQSIRDLQSEALKAGAAGDDALAAKFTAAAGKARDRMADLNKEINAAQDTGSKLGAVTGVARSLAGGFAGAAGAAALFGSAQKDVQEQLLKVQGAVALLAGIQEVADIKKNFNIAKTIVLQEVALAQTKLGIAAESGGIVVRNLAAAAQWALNAAMSANPIMLIVVGIGALVAAFQIFSKESETAAEKTAKLNEQLKLQEKVLDLVVKKLKEEQLLRAGGLSDLERENELLKVNGATKEEVYKSDRNILEQKIKDWEIQKAAILSQRVLTAEELNTQADLKNKLLVLDAKYLKELQDERNQKAEEEKKKRDEKHQQELKDRKDLKEKIAALELDLEFSIEKTNKDKKEKDQKAKEDEMTNAIVDSNKKYEQAAKTEKTIYDNKKLINAQTLKDEQSIRDAKLNIAQQTLNGLTSLSKLAGLKGKEAENLQKALAVVQIAIDTAKAISSTIAGATAAAAAGGPAAPFLMVSYITSGIASVLGAMASAKAALSSAGSSPAPDPSINVPGVSGGGGSAPLTPTSSNVGNTSTIISESGQVVAPMVVKAYVVESEMTNHQQHIKNIEQKATFP